MKNSWVPLVDFNNPSSSSGPFNPPNLDEVNKIFSSYYVQQIYGSSASLVISGQVTTIPIFNANIKYYGPNTSSANSLPVLSIGCWLPQGFSYNNGSSNFKQGTTPLYSSETTISCAGNIAVVWTFTNKTFYDLQAAMGQTAGSQDLAINFSYTTSLTRLPECLPWVVWGSGAGEFTWDADITVSDMTASAGTAAAGWMDIEAYVPKSQTRMLGNALPGDYVAIGGSNLTDTNGDSLRETPIGSSIATVSSGTASGQIPSTAAVEAAYLYWGGWARGDGTDMITGSGELKNYDPSITMLCPSGHSEDVTASPANPDDIVWYKTVQSGRSVTITITANNSTIVGSGSLPGDDVRVGDKITTSVTGATTWYTVTAINVGGDSTKISVTPTPTVNATAVPYWVFDGYYYACKKDVTDFVRDYSNGANLAASPKVYGNGTGTYTISNLLSDTKCVQDPGTVCTSAWAGWSLVIVYSDVTTLGHQLYLYDNFQSIANNSGNNLTEISGFIVPYPVAGDTGTDAVKITAFVGEGDNAITSGNVGDYFAIRTQSNSSIDNKLWDGVTDDINPSTHVNWDTQASPLDAYNGESPNLNASGVDIDTFHVPWSANLVQTNDTTATINMYTIADGLVSVYVIASFRSSVTSGGSVSYLIKKRPPAP